jgi:hypothetical protein
MTEPHEPPAGRWRKEVKDLRQQCDAQLAELEAISAALGTSEGHSSVTHILDLRQQLADSQKQVNTARDYLERLACLGNGDQHGNSNGNCLAIEALAAMEPK